MYTLRNGMKLAAMCLFTFASLQVSAQTNLALTASENHSGGGVNSTGYGPNNYNDNNWNQSCSPTPWGWVSTNGWIEFTWSSPQNVGKMVFYKSNRPMTSCTIQYWNGSSYTNIMNYSGSSCEDSVTFTTPVTTTRIRMQSVSGSSNPNHREIFIYGPPCSTAVAKQPVGTTVCENEDAEFSISAIDVTNYQWQVDEGSGFNDVANNTIYSGATTNKLTITKTPFNMNGYQFRCLVSKTVCADTSNIVGLAVNGLVKLDKIPAKDTACRSSNKDLEVEAQGSILSYQWQRYNSITQQYEDVPHVAPYLHLGKTLQIVGVPDTLNGARYRCLVNGVCDSAASNETFLTVTEIPKVAVPPADKNAKPGEDIIFQVQSTAPGSRFQWQVAAPDTFVNINEGGIYEGVKTNRLKVYGVSRVQDKFKFRCVVKTGSACIAPGDTSQFAVLYVEPAASVSSVYGGASVVLYPNPVTGSDLYVKLDGIEAEGLEYKITDKTGRLVLAGELNSKKYIDISGLAADVYLVDILDENGAVARAKFTKL